LYASVGLLLLVVLVLTLCLLSPLSAGMRDEGLLREVNHLATQRFMHLIAPHPDTGVPPARLAGLLPPGFRGLSGYMLANRCGYLPAPMSQFSLYPSEVLCHAVLLLHSAGKQQEVLRLGMGVLMGMMVQRMEAAAAAAEAAAQSASSGEGAAAAAGSSSSSTGSDGASSSSGASSSATPAATRMFLYSGHDSSLMPLLAALGKDVRDWPPYLSSLALELWRRPTGQRYVKVGQGFWLALKGNLRCCCCPGAAWRFRSSACCSRAAPASSTAPQPPTNTASRCRCYTTQSRSPSLSSAAAPPASCSSSSKHAGLAGQLPHCPFQALPAHPQAVPGMLSVTLTSTLMPPVLLSWLSPAGTT
jgi:hypothetical protein